MSSQPAPNTGLPGTDPNAESSAKHNAGFDALLRKRQQLIADTTARAKANLTMLDAKEAEEAAAASRAESAATVDAAASEISTNNTTVEGYNTEISTLKASQFKTDATGDYVKTPEQRKVIGEHIKSLQEDRDALDAKNIKIAEDLKAKAAADNSGFDWDNALDKTGKIGNLAIGGALLYEWWNKEDPPTPPSAGETARELSSVTADREFGINQQLANYGPGLATDALQDADLAAEWNAAGSPDFNTWVQSVMADPTSPTARKLADMLDPLNVESKERGRRIDEAANFYNEYDASQFQSPEMQAAQSYASGLTSDPLSMQNRQYMEQELAGDYSQGFYDDLRADLFSSMHPNAVGTSLGMTKAALGAESAIRGRRDAASDRIARDDALRMSYAPSYASIAASGSADPLSLSNVGKMGIGNIEPMDPTGAFFGSFPAMEYDTNLAAYQRQPTTIQTLTALGQAAQQFKK